MWRWRNVPGRRQWREAGGLMCTEKDRDRKLEEKEAKRWRGGGEEHVGCRTLKTAPSKQAVRISLKIWIVTAESYCCYYFREKTKYNILLGLNTDPPGWDLWEVSEVVSDSMNQTGESSQISNSPLLNSYFAVHLHGIVFPCGRISRPTPGPLRDLWDDTFLQMAPGRRRCFLSAWRCVIFARRIVGSDIHCPYRVKASPLLKSCRHWSKVRSRESALLDRQILKLSTFNHQRFIYP